jgi:hypothetical protein
MSKKLGQLLVVVLGQAAVVAWYWGMRGKAMPARLVVDRWSCLRR